MKRGVGFLLFVLFIVGLPIHVGASDWGTSQRDFSRNATVQDVSAPNVLSLQWTKTPTLGNFQMPVYQDGIFYFSEESGVADVSKTWNVYAVSKTTGEEIWRKSGSGLLKSSPTVLDDHIIIPGENLIALNSKTGTEIWRRKAEANYFFVDPMISGSQLFVMERNIYYSGNLESINMIDGTLSWKNALYVYNYNPPSFFGDNIVTTTGLSPNFAVIKSFKMSTGSLNWTYQHIYNPVGSVVVDETAGIGVLSLAVGSVVAINLNSGLKAVEFWVSAYPTRATLSEDSAYFLSTESNKTIFNRCSYITGFCSLHEKIADSQIYERRAVPMMIGNKFYFPSLDGKIYGVKSDDGDEESYQASDPSLALFYSMYADGAFILSDLYMKKLYVLGNGAEPISAESRVELDSPYKTDGVYTPYLGQLHSHYIPDVLAWSKLFNGDPTPSFTENKYKDAGYDFVALTEHDQIINDPGVGGILHIANSEEDTQPQGGNHILALGIQNPIDETQSEQARIDAVASQGGVPVLAHPNSKQYSWSLKSLMSLKNYSALEIRNNGISWLDKTGFAGSSLAFDKWDSLLSTGKKVYGTAGDDYTPGDPGFDGGAVVVFAQTNSQSDILNNLKNGNFYAVQGSRAPKITVSTNNNQIIVNFDRLSTIRFVSHGEVIKELKDTNFATYSANGNETYVRAEIESGGRKSWSEPIFVNLRQSATTPFPGGYNVDFGTAILKVKSAAQVQVTTLPVSQYPANSPQLGYLGQIISVTSDGTLETGTKLTASYKNNTLLTNEDNLSIYKYSQDTGIWEKVPSTIDETTKTVTADILDPSQYVLSGEEPEDLISPTISLDSSLDLNNFDGEIKIVANDNNAVIKTSFYIDGNLVAEDTSGSDGWGVDVDISNYSAGEHKLIATAEDLSGNTGQAEYIFTIPNSIFIAPEISLSVPAENSELWDVSNIIGSFSSALTVNNISLYLDDYFIEESDVNGNNFSKDLNWSGYREGNHVMKVALTDSMGNKAEISRNVLIGQEVVATIISPDKSSYLTSDRISFSFSANKTSVVAKLDGNIISNGTEKNGSELGIGAHSFTLEYSGSVIANKDFIVASPVIPPKCSGKVDKIIHNWGQFKKLIRGEIAKIFHVSKHEIKCSEIIKPKNQVLDLYSLVSKPDPKNKVSIGITIAIIKKNR